MSKWPALSDAPALAARSLAVASLLLASAGVTADPTLSGTDTCATQGDAGDGFRDATRLVRPQACAGSLARDAEGDAQDWYTIAQPPLSDNIRLQGEWCATNPGGVLVVKILFNDYPKEILSIPPDDEPGFRAVGPSCHRFNAEPIGLSAIWGGAWYLVLEGNEGPADYTLSVA